MGYHMTIVKEADCISSRVKSVIESFVPTAKQVTDVGAELTFTLPSSATPKFPELFDKFEGKSNGTEL